MLLLHSFSQLGFLKDIWHKDCKHVSRTTLYALRCVLSAIFVVHCHGFDYAHFCLVHLSIQCKTFVTFSCHRTFHSLFLRKLYLLISQLYQMACLHFV